jgi:hypothetical protein
VTEIAAKQMVISLQLALRTEGPPAFITFSPGDAGWVLKTELWFVHLQKSSPMELSGFRAVEVKPSSRNFLFDISSSPD